MVVVTVIVGNEEDRKGEGVVTQFHPVIWVVHDPFTVTLSK